MARPDPVAGRDGLPVAERLHLSQIGTHQYPPADRARVPPGAVPSRVPGPRLG